MVQSQMVVIVDAYSTGRFLASRFHREGLQCVHVQSQQQIPAMLHGSFQQDDFVENIIAGEDVSTIFDALNKYSIVAVVAGSEPGVLLADQLSEHFGLLSNGSDYSKARVDKYKMIEALSDADVACMPYIKSDHLNQILTWSCKQAGTIVLKPLQSAGNDGVFFCETADDISRSFYQILNNDTIFNHSNQAVLAQPLLNGTEYIVNAVSYQGCHKITDIWRCEKKFIPGKSNISMLEALVHPEDPACHQLIPYAKQVLQALHIQHGPGHMEVMLTEKGPVLIECAARLQGCVDPKAVEAALGYSQLSAMVMAYANPKKFEQLPQVYHLKQYVYRLFMCSYREGLLSEAVDFDVIKQLPSFFSLNAALHKGQRLRKTVDIATIPGYLHFINSELEQLQADYCSYRDTEKNGRLISGCLL